MARYSVEASRKNGPDLKPDQDRAWAAFGYRMGTVLIILLAIAIRAEGMSQLGTQSDEGVHIVVAERLAAGDTLYRDLFENRTPAVEVILSGAFNLAGANVVMARLLSLATAGLTLAGLMLSAKLLQRKSVRLSGDKVRLPNLAGWTAGLLFGLAPLAVFWSRFVMLEQWQTAAATLAVTAALLASAGGKMRWWAASGVLAALAILSKQSGLVVAVALLGYLLLLQRPTAGRRPRMALAAWLGGLTAVLLLFLAWLAVQGALGDFLRFLSAAERLAPTAQLMAKVQTLGRWALRRPLFVLALAGAAAILRGRGKAGWLALLWALGEVGALFGPELLDTGWGGYSHYTVPALAALSLLAGLGLAQVATWAVGGRGQKLLAAGFLTVVLAMAGGWLADLGYALGQRDYPQQGFVDEGHIGHYAAAVTGESEPILVMGNASFYHWAGRRPANRFFHLSAYMPESGLWPEAEADLLSAMGDEALGTLLASRMHLEERLSDAMKDSLRADWLPVALFSYPYQRDVFLYQRRPDTAGLEKTSLATYNAGIRLRAVVVTKIDEQTLAVELWWSADETPSQDWTVFTHLLDPAGQVVAQNDAVPEVGFRPTSGWAPGEIIVDSHWLVIPEGRALDGARLSIGLYDPVTGQRSDVLEVSGLHDGPGALDSYLLDVEQEMQ